ncbi:hypothetical protein OF83DRAFT_1084758 [Amylostereum chailletii]|nr:hypothetical protein OF83DRAFT_1084758 [Amylostereum chailletii]
MCPHPALPMRATRCRCLSDTTYVCEHAFTVWEACDGESKRWEGGGLGPGGYVDPHAFSPAAASTMSKMSSPTTSPCSSTSGTTPALREHKENRPPFAAAQAGLSSHFPSPGISPLPPHNATQAVPPLREASAGVPALPIFSPSLWALAGPPVPAIIQQLLGDVVRCIEEWHDDALRIPGDVTRLARQGLFLLEL